MLTKSGAAQMAHAHITQQDPMTHHFLLPDLLSALEQLKTLLKLAIQSVVSIDWKTTPILKILGVLSKHVVMKIDVLYNTVCATEMFCARTRTI